MFSKEFTSLCGTQTNFVKTYLFLSVRIAIDYSWHIGSTSDIGFVYLWHLLCFCEVFFCVSLCILRFLANQVSFRLCAWMDMYGGIYFSFYLFIKLLLFPIATAWLSTSCLHSVGVLVAKKLSYRGRPQCHAFSSKED